MFPITHLPSKPGCYLFKDLRGIILYVGKAKDLKKRVRSYFHHPVIDEKTQNLINHVSAIDFIVTDTEIEALVLENTLIKKHQPKYNINLKDAKSYAYLRITDELFPRVLVTRGRSVKGRYFGPFVSAQERDYILQFLKKTFHLRTCKKLPNKPCLRYHIHLCDAPCIGNISKEEYQVNIKNIIRVLNGNIQEAVNILEEEMKVHSEKQAYEYALRRREQISALQHLQERQNMQRDKTYNEDIINYLIKDDTVYLMMFNIYKGTLTNKNDFIFAFHDEFFEEFLLQYYADNPIPKELILPQTIDETLLLFLEQQKGKKVQVTIPKRGEKKQLLELVKKNIDITFFAADIKISALQQRIRLHEKPHIIECFDISHLSGTSMVGSMVQFRNGKPDKSNYRRFRIRTVEQIDDTKSINEIVRRRYYRLVKENTSFPNLIIIDGGRGQLNSALSALDDLGLTIPVISIAKQFEELYIPGRPSPLQLQKSDIALRYVQEIRDEAHRFALAYNRFLRRKQVIS